jgi:hypothetical protein
MAESHLARVTTMAFGINLLGSAIAYVILQLTIFSAEGPEHPLKTALGSDMKGKISPVLYVLGIVFAALSGEEARWATALAVGLFVLVAIIWVIPDRRIERAFGEVRTTN